jgi:hypothetical protein
MSFVKFTVFEDGSEDEDTLGPQFSNIIEEEEYEEEPEAFQGFQRGFSEEAETPDPAPRPWDPSEQALGALWDQMSCTER